jgi:CPA2 family monovalent cation:H+ antiporter-2/glutathione-regulated potassium-efflux system protein KefB
VLLSESTFRHQLETDVEPFRGILLGLFFLAVGMSLDLAVIAENWRLVATSVAAFMVLKACGTYTIALLFGASAREALERTVLMTQGGEFAFVLYGTALSVGLIDGTANAVLTAIIIVSMVLTPLFVLLHDRLIRPEAVSEDGTERPDGLSGNILVIGFGRVQPDRQPADPGARLYDFHHRQRPRDDPRSGVLWLQGLLWRRHPA